MPTLPDSINSNSSILVSRNRPVAFVVGVAGFIGSHLAEQLIDKGVQVIGVDDLLEVDTNLGISKNNLNQLTKSKDFHFLNQLISNDFSIDISRLDYVFFVKQNYQTSTFQRELLHLLEFIKTREESINEKENSKKSPKIVLTSSIKLYQNEPNREFDYLKEAEIKLAKFAKSYNLNARVIRFSALYGPGMGFFEDDSMVRLIEASLLNKLQDESVSQEFSTRALYIDDAVNLILKTVFSGATAQKIYDGVLIPPVKVIEVKQILLDPLWHESKKFKAAELPIWSTPNLKRTIKELSWVPKTDLVKSLRETVVYFKEFKITVPEKETRKIENKHTFIDEDEPGPEPLFGSREDDDKENKPSTGKSKYKNPFTKRNVIIFLGLAIIVYGLIFPVLSLGFGLVNITQGLMNSKQALIKGDFAEALKNTTSAKKSAQQIRGMVGSLTIAKKIPWLGERVNKIEILMDATQEGIDGVNHGVLGMQALYKTTKIISGESNEDPKSLYQDAQFELSTGSQKIAKVSVVLSDRNLTNLFPEILAGSLKDLQSKLNSYNQLVDRGKSVSYLLPEITAVDSNKVYLVLFQDNLELRPTGGVINSYARLEFEKGRIKKMTVDDVSNLDSKLTEHIEPPIEIKNDLNQKDWYLRDSNFEPDFPSSAKQAEFFYNKEVGDRVQGVIALDLSGSAKLLKAVGGLSLTDYNESVDENNLLEKAMRHIQASPSASLSTTKNFLSSLENQLMNKVLFLNDQNWSAIVIALSELLEEKHLLVNISDPQTFSYIASQDWAGIMPRQNEALKGQTADFLSLVEANLGSNKSNYYLERKYRLESNISKENAVKHHLVISYKNNSPSLEFPAGSYKNRLRIYVPTGAKITKAVFGEEDITAQVSTFSDYGRTVFSVLIQVAPKEQKALMIDYQLANSLDFVGNTNFYNLDILKQSGTDQDNFEWDVNYSNDLVVQNADKNFQLTDHRLTLITNLKTNKSFYLELLKK